MLAQISNLDFLKVTFIMCGLIPLIEIFRHRSKTFLINLIFSILPLLWENSTHMPWGTLCIGAILLGIIIVTISMVGFMTLAVLFRRQLVFWAEDYPQHGRDFVGAPLLFPAKLSHARVFPEKYSYWYSYFVVGVPVGLHARIGTVLSIDINRPLSNPGNANSNPKNKRIRSCWFTIDPVQYLDRGNDHLGLEGKLHAWLISQVCSVILTY